MLSGEVMRFVMSLSTVRCCAEPAVSLLIAERMRWRVQKTSPNDFRSLSWISESIDPSIFSFLNMAWTSRPTSTSVDSKETTWSSTNESLPCCRMRQNLFWSNVQNASSGQMAWSSSSHLLFKCAKITFVIATTQSLSKSLP